jgi:uncharacterized membrane protein YjjP (DUF1212 family)
MSDPNYSGPGNVPPPYAPQQGYPPPPGYPPQQGYPPPPSPTRPAGTASTLLLWSKAVVVAGLVAAAAGVLGGFLFFAVDALNGTYKTAQFFVSVVAGLCKSATAVALGLLLRLHVEQGEATTRRS